MSDKELFDQIRSITSSGWHDLNSKSTGAPGNLLEKLLGLGVSNEDTPDAGGKWEIKFSSGKSLLTLLHNTPLPKEKGNSAIKHLIDNFGKPGKNSGLLSFRHTIRGTSKQGFKIEVDDDKVWVHHPELKDIVPYWTKDDLLVAAAGKLRRLILVYGEKRKEGDKGQVRYNRAVAYREFRLSKFLAGLETGLVAVDFDARLNKSGSIRDHGTKFRVKHENLAKIYKGCDDI